VSGGSGREAEVLAAHAITALIDGTAGVARSGRPEFVVVIDADSTDSPGPVADWSIPVEIPTRVPRSSPVTPSSMPSSSATASCCTHPAS